MKLFGTDGVRGYAGKFLTAQVTLKVAMAAGIYFKKYSKSRRILVGKDTRKSGYMIENSLVSGLTAVGYDVIQTGPIPTPAVAFLTQNMRCDAGIMISASHNDYHDNGIKLFDSNGDKFSSDIEKEIEKIYNDDEKIAKYQVFDEDIGSSRRIDGVIGRYIVQLKNSFPLKCNLSGTRIVLDTANGAAYKVAPMILEELGAEVITINNSPNGLNINDNCGALHPDGVIKMVKETRADIGFALDGDADRLVVIDERGSVVDGDHLIGSLALFLKSTNALKGKGVVTTVMSNKGLEGFLETNQLKLHRSDVGDKNVLELMKEKNINFGGEESGHIILHDYAKTGDGLATALQVLSYFIQSNEKISTLLRPFDLSPQITTNLNISHKPPLKDIKGLGEVLQKIEAKNIRHLIRYSGTENKLRLLLESNNKTQLTKEMEALEIFFKKAL